MEEIRPFEAEQASEAANLYLGAVRGQKRPAPQYLIDYFREVYLENPWASPDITSLVYLREGRVAGFVGVVPRPWTFQGRPIRVAASTLFMMDRGQGGGVGGIKLLRRLFDGPQDLAFSDGTANEASTVFAAAGARVSHLYSFNWIRLMRPFGTAQGLLDRLGGPFPRLKPFAGLVTGPLDFLASKAPLGMLRRPQCAFTSRPATPEQLLECIAESRGRESLKPVREGPSFQWLLWQAGRGSGHANLRSMTVHSPDGARAGWFVYFAPPGLPAFVLEVSALRRQHFGEVLSAMFADAWHQKCTAVKGQAIPQHLTTLTEQHCVFRQPDSRVVAHARNPAIMAAFLSGDCGLSRLDGAAWLRFATEDWNDPNGTGLRSAASPVSDLD
jgi:hypothetical protein